jgi:hypothetical protein
MLRLPRIVAGRAGRGPSSVRTATCPSAPLRKPTTTVRLSLSYYTLRHQGLTTPDACTGVCDGWETAFEHLADLLAMQQATAH